MGVQSKELPNTVSPEAIRICRDHSVRVSEEIERIMRKLPQLRGIFSYNVGETNLSMTDMQSTFLALKWFLNKEWERVRPKNTKANLTPTHLMGRRCRRGKSVGYNLAGSPSKVKSPKPLPVLLSVDEADDL